MSCIIPDYLLPGDQIGLVATARKISREELQFASDLIKQNGFEPVFAKNLFGAFYQFSGTDEERASDFQEMMDSPDIKAILCVRGGYGTIRVLDKVDWSKFAQNPKWICGYSDVTVLHAHLQEVLNIASLHSSMPINFETNSPEAVKSLFQNLRTKPSPIRSEPHPLNIPGIAQGKIVGGNLSVLYSLMGSSQQVNAKGKILFLEDLDEYLYHVDRMMQNMLRAGVIDGIKGLVVGGMTEMNDNTVPFGKTAEQIIHETLRPFNVPILFNFPAGHIDNNTAIVLGQEVRIEVGTKNELSYL